MALFFIHYGAVQEKHYTLLDLSFVTRFWVNDPNHTSFKIKLISVVNSYTTILPVQTLSLTQS